MEVEYHQIPIGSNGKCTALPQVLKLSFFLRSELPLKLNHDLSLIAWICCKYIEHGTMNLGWRLYYLITILLY